MSLELVPKPRAAIEDITEFHRKNARRRVFGREEVTESDRAQAARAIATTFGRSPQFVTGGERDLKGASVNATNYNWRGSNASADGVAQMGLPLVRARARDAEENIAYGERYLAELEANVLGPTGMRMQSQIMKPDGKASDAESVPDEQANRQLENEYDEFKQLGVCDVSGEYTFHELERVSLRSAARDGEVLIRHVENWNGNQYGYALQMIESDALDHSYNTTLPNGNIVVMGVEMDQWRRRIAYHILTRHPGDFWTPQNMRRERRERVEARDIIHLRFLRRVGQTRGWSWFNPVLDLMEMLRGYEEAELISARAEACKGGFFYSDLVPEGGFVGEPPDPMKMARKQLSPAQMERLPYGVKFQAHNPTHPNGNYSGFREGVLRGVASGLSTSYNILANDLKGVSYSSLRGGLLDEREIYKMLQAWFTTRFEMLIFQRWLDNALLRRRVTIPVSRIGKMRPYFQGRRWDWVDPLKDIEAIAMAIETGLTSLRAEVLKRDGGDILDVAKEQKADKELMNSAGLDWNWARVVEVARKARIDREREEAQDLNNQ